MIMVYKVINTCKVQTESVAEKITPIAANECHLSYIIQKKKKKVQFKQNLFAIIIDIPR